MDVKDLRTDPALSERSNDGNANYAHSGPSFPSTDKNKSYHDMGSNSLPKVDVPTTRPCAVIGPDRIIPPQAANDPYIKRGHVEPWQFTRPPEYPHKMPEYQHVSRNISPRQTFQENMQRIMVPPRSLKLPEDTNFSAEKNIPVSKNIPKANMPTEAKYCDVPYSVNLLTNDPKNARNSEHSVSYVNPTIVRGLPHAWPPAGVNVRPPHPYGTPDAYHYPDYTNCTAPRAAPVIRPLRTGLEDPTHMYHDPYRGGNIRYEPYPTLKERNPMSRYEYFSNYSNPYPPPLYTSHKYDVQKLPTNNTTLPHQTYPGYPQVPLKYLREPPKDGYQRAPNPQPNFNVPYNQNTYPNYGSVPGNCLQSKLYTYPPDSTFNAASNAKTLYDMNSKPYVKHNDNIQPKHFSTHENLYLNEAPRSHMKPPMGIPGYQSVNMHPLPPYPYYRKESMPLRSYDYSAQYKHNDPSYNTQMSRISSQFSPNIISPVESNASNDNHGFAVSPEDCGYVSQSSTTSVRSTDSMYRVYDPRYGHINRASPITSRSEYDPKTTGNKDKKGIDVRQFLQMWNEGEDEHNESHTNKDKVVQSTANDGKQYEVVSNQDQLYVLGLVNVPSEELGKYEHIQKVSKLPENIKGYTSIDLLNQFEEAIESSNISDFPAASTDTKVIQVSTKPNVLSKGPNLVSPNLPPRPLSPLDVEAKISQSVIHKEVGCNFEIRPCSPKLFNVEAAAPAQTLLDERAIEKVTNRHVVQSPQVLSNIGDNSNNCHIIKRQDRRRSLNRESNTNNPSCKMVKSQYTNDVEETEKSNYTIQDLESNSGVCLASLPRLDNDIELSFPEVNQQFINANKAESVITTPCNSLSLMETGNSQIAIAKESNDMKCSNSYPFSPTSKEFSKLSKYRKVRGNKESQQSSQVIRTDSVIIKNPENNGNISELKQPLTTPSNLAEEPTNNLCEPAPMNLAINNHQPGSGTAKISSNYNKSCDITPKNNIQEVSENIAINLSFNSKTEHTDENMIEKFDIRKSHKIINEKESSETDVPFHFSTGRERKSESVPEDYSVSESNNQNNEDFSKTHESEEKRNQSLNVKPQCEKEILLSSENRGKSSPKMTSKISSENSQVMEVINDDIRRNLENSYDGSNTSTTRIIHNISELKTGYKTNNDTSLYQILEDGVGATLATLLSPLSDDSINDVSQDSFINKDENRFIDNSSECETEENILVSCKPYNINSDKTMSIPEQCSDSFGKILIGMTKTQDLDKTCNIEEAATDTKLNSAPDPFLGAIKSDAKTFENSSHGNLSKRDDLDKTGGIPEFATDVSVTSKSNVYSNLMGADVISKNTNLAIQSKPHNTESDNTAGSDDSDCTDRIPKVVTDISVIATSDKTTNTDKSKIKPFQNVPLNNTSKPVNLPKTKNSPEVPTEIPYTSQSGKYSKPIKTDMNTLEVYCTKTSKHKELNATTCTSEVTTDTAFTSTSDQYSNYVQSDLNPSPHVQADTSEFKNSADPTSILQDPVDTAVPLKSDQYSNSFKLELTPFEYISQTDISKPENSDETSNVPQGAADTVVPLTSDQCSDAIKTELSSFKNVSHADISKPNNFYERTNIPQGATDAAVSLTSDRCSNSIESDISPIENVSCANIPKLDDIDGTANIPEEICDTAILLPSGQSSNSNKSELTLFENVSGSDISKPDDSNKSGKITQEAADTGVPLTSDQCSKSIKLQLVQIENVSRVDLSKHDKSDERSSIPELATVVHSILKSDECLNSIKTDVKLLEQIRHADTSKPGDTDNMVNRLEVESGTTFTYSSNQCSNSVETDLKSFKNYTSEKNTIYNESDSANSQLKVAMDTGFTSTSDQCSNTVKSEINLFENVSQTRKPILDDSDKTMSTPEVINDNYSTLKSDEYSNSEADVKSLEKDFHADTSKSEGSNDTASILQMVDDNAFVLTSDRSTNPVESYVKPFENVPCENIIEHNASEEIASTPEIATDVTKTSDKCFNLTKTSIKSTANVLKCNHSNMTEETPKLLTDTKLNLRPDQCSNSIESFVKLFDRVSNADISKVLNEPDTPFTSALDQCSNSAESDVQSLENILRSNIPESFNCDEYKRGTSPDNWSNSIKSDVKSLNKIRPVLQNSSNSESFDGIRDDNSSCEKLLTTDESENHAKHIQSLDTPIKMCIDTLGTAYGNISPNCSNIVRDKNSRNVYQISKSVTNAVINKDIEVKYEPTNTPCATVEESSMNEYKWSSKDKKKYKKLHFSKKLFSPAFQNLVIFQEGFIGKSSENFSAKCYPTEYETNCNEFETALRVTKTDLKNEFKKIKEINEDLLGVSEEKNPKTVNHRSKQLNPGNYTILEENLNTEINNEEINSTKDNINYDTKGKDLFKENSRANNYTENDTINKINIVSSRKNTISIPVYLQNSEQNQVQKENLLGSCIEIEKTVEKENKSDSKNYKRIKNETILNVKSSIKTELFQCTPEKTANPQQQHLENYTHEKIKSRKQHLHSADVKTISEALYDKKHIDESVKINYDIETYCKYTTEEYQERPLHDKSINLDEFTTTNKIYCETIRSDSRIVAYSDSSIESDYMEYNLIDTSETFREQQEQPTANVGTDTQTRHNEICKDNNISEDTLVCKIISDKAMPSKSIIETDETECISMQWFENCHEKPQYECDDDTQTENKEKINENVLKTDDAGSKISLTDSSINMSLEPIIPEPDRSTKPNYVCISKEEQDNISDRTCKTSTPLAGRRTLKRSLSESALYYATENPKLEDIPNWVHRSSLWPNKRKKIEDGFEEDSNTINNESDCNFVQNRRNSISSFYHGDNVSFCILIDDNCIITEEDYEEEEAVCFADIQDENFNAAVNSHLISDNVVYHQPATSFSQDEFSKSISLDCTSEKEIEENWVEDVACVETVVSDDIVEDDDELYGDNRSPSPECEDVFDYTDKIKNIYGDEMCSNDIHLIKTLYSTPQMDVNKTLHDKESLVEFARQGKNNIEEDNILSSHNISEATSEYIETETDDLNSSKAEPEIEKLQIKEFEDNVKSNHNNEIIECRPENLLELANELTSKTVDTCCRAQDDTVHSWEASLIEVTCLNEPTESTKYKRSSSSPEVSSTTSEDKKSGILLKITNYNGSRVSQINNVDLDNTKRIRCKFTEDSDYLSGKSNSSKSRPLITKAAQKYIPPLKETIRDLKVKLFLPEDSLIKLKQLKVSKETPKIMSANQLRAGKPTFNNNNKIIPKKLKPKFEDVLKSIDEVQAQMRKERSKKIKKSVPKVIIKKTENGLYNTSTLDKDTFNPDLTGRKWQPWVFIERNKFIDKMALKGKKRAVFCHRKNTYILAEYFQKYKSEGSTKFIISQPKSENLSPGPFKYTIKLKQSY